MIESRIWSLWKIMKDFDAWGLAMLFSHISQADQQAQLYILQGKRDDNVSEDFMEAFGVKGIVVQALHHAEASDLQSTRDRVWENGSFTLAVKTAITFQELRHQLEVLQECIQADLEKRHFLYIPPERIRWSEQLRSKEDHWQKIWHQFPSARYDSKEAAFCYSLERNTACVFHAMRVAEIGLRALARRMKVKLPKKKRLEWAEWQDMLREMNAIAERVAQSKAGPKRQELLEFYRGALGQFYGFKDEYRNQVMHSRKSYDQFQAASVLTHVKDFMSKLAERIDEKGNKITWVEQL